VNNQEPQSRMQRYNFNTDKNQPPKRKGPKRPSRLRQIIVSFLVTLALVVGVGVWLANRTTKVENGAENTEQSVNDNSSSNKRADSSSQSTASRSVPDNSTEDSSNGSTYDKGVTSSQRNSLQSSINQESDATIKNREQKKLNDAKAKSDTRQSSSSANTTSSNSAGSSSKKTDNNKNNSGSITFSQSHTFSSVSDAKSWAQATKSQWLKDGYSTYTITSDAQGNYVLRFVK